MSTWEEITTDTLAAEWKTRAVAQLVHAGVASPELERADPDLCFAFLDDGRLLLPIGPDHWVVLRDPDNFDGPQCCPGSLVAHILSSRAVADMLNAARVIRAAAGPGGVRRKS
ncbi:hypothetical protein KGQ20_13860 [Catenulispora sp. NF23]|uniref:hypothetical protein n=1 Tax=Catenulispora pinistramenti TaxID=2705254 RepID=UPI001BAAED12|nr:hypothetical protein [Catenulispora pinistramenti]MBS2533854.1 hypothetical protein [Catenulispora pinistramenti]